VDLIALALLLLSVDGSSFVFRACFRDTDYDVAMRAAATREAADACIFLQTCEAAEIIIRADPAAARTFWVTTGPGRCR